MTGQQKALIKNLWQSSETYQALVALAEDQIALWAKMPPDKSSEWSFLSFELVREGQISGVKVLLNAIERMASDKKL